MAYSIIAQLFEYNYAHNDPFRKYCDSLGIMYRGFYGEDTASLADMKRAKSAWIKMGHVYYKSIFENDMAHEAMPFEGWKSEKEEQAFLKAFRKINRCNNSEVRNFIRAWLDDPEWDF